MYWGPEGIGCHQCVRRPEQEPTQEEKTRIGHDFITQLRATACSPGTPVRVSAEQWGALLQTLDPEDIYVDHGQFIGMRVWITGQVIAAIEAVYEDDYVAVASYINVDDWTPPGISIAALQESERRAS
jgi:hypothetical protein